MKAQKNIKYLVLLIVVIVAIVLVYSNFQTADDEETGAPTRAFDAAFVEGGVLSVDGITANIEVTKISDYYRYSYATYPELKVGDTIHISIDIAKVIEIESPPDKTIETGEIKCTESYCYAEGYTEGGVQKTIDMSDFSEENIKNFVLTLDGKHLSARIECRTTCEANQWYGYITNVV